MASQLLEQLIEGEDLTTPTLCQYPAVSGLFPFCEKHIEGYTLYVHCSSLATQNVAKWSKYKYMYKPITSQAAYMQSVPVTLVE